MVARKRARGSRCFIGTYFVPDTEHKAQWTRDITKMYNDHLVRFARWNHELCPTTKRDHYQIAIIMKDATTLSALHKHFKKFNGNLQAAKNQAAVLAYCKKKDTQGDEGTTEIGEEPKGQGHRTDWDAKRELCKKRKLDVMDSDPELLLKYPRGVQTIKACHNSRLPHLGDWEVILLENVGITEHLKANDYKPEDVFVFHSDTKWEGYDDQKIVYYPSGGQIDSIESGVPQWMWHRLRLPQRVLYGTVVVNPDKFFIYNRM